MTHKPMTQDEVLAVLDEAIRKTEATMPTPINRRAESTEHPAHHATRLHDMKRARATIAAWNVSPSADVVGEPSFLRVVAKRNLRSLIQRLGDDADKKTMLACLEELS